MAKERERFEKIADKIAEERDCDTLVYIGGVNVYSARQFVNVINGRKHRRKNLHLILGTNGGEANAAYKIARSFQHAYEKGTVTVGVYGDCKSAGTLIAIGAHDIVMCQHGEFGPLDVQMKKDDQLFVRSSGLTTAQAMESLKKEAFVQFEHFLLEIHDRTGYEISTRLATSMAIRMVVGLLGPVYQQIDPMRIGETQRAMDVAMAYGERLNVGRNLKPDALQRLVQKYPSHDFAIDFEEAKQLFVRLKRTDDLQRELGEQLAHHLLDYGSISQRPAITLYLNSEPTITATQGDEQDATENPAPAGTKPSSAPRHGGPETVGSDGGGAETPESGGHGGAAPAVKNARTGAKTASGNGERRQ